MSLACHSFTAKCIMVIDHGMYKIYVRPDIILKKEPISSKMYLVMKQYETTKVSNSESEQQREFETTKVQNNESIKQRKCEAKNPRKS